VQDLYNPDPKRSDFIDRPYAGRLLATAAWHDLSEGFHRTIEAGLGVRGPAALGRESQELIHRIIPGPETDWSRQLPNRVDAQVVGVHTHEFGVRSGHRERGALHYGAVVGNHLSFVHAGIELRTSGAHSIETPALRFAATPPVARGGARGWSGFVGVSVRAILRNTLLEGNNNPFGPLLERKDFVLRSALGIAWSAPFGAITFGITQDTREFEAQRRNHRFGALGIRLDFL
jgi:lipid A 3-O-deacylase